LTFSASVVRIGKISTGGCLANMTPLIVRIKVKNYYTEIKERSLKTETQRERKGNTNKEKQIRKYIQRERKEDKDKEKEKKIKTKRNIKGNTHKT